MGALPTIDSGSLKDRVTGVLELPQESRAVELKRAAKWEELKKGIPKDILAMSNLRDGGIIVIGVQEKDNKWNRTGMTEDQLSTYDPDNMIDHINKYASPPITVDVVTYTDDKGLNYLVIQVHEFKEKLIVCKRNCPDELREGAFYIRPIGKAESREVQNAEEMHDLLELAAEKRTRNFLRQIQRAGIDLATVPLEKTDADKFDDELEGL